MKNLLKFKGILVVVMMGLTLVCGCDNKGKPADAEITTTQATETQPIETTAPEVMNSAVLYTNLFAGDETAAYVEHTCEFSGEMTALELGEQLSELTGLDFYFTVTDAADGIIIDWSADSTLIANIGDTEQKKEFFVYDTESMHWFMMDSLWKTLSMNLEIDNIYYTMDGGQELTFDEATYIPVDTFPMDIPYLGSPFYKAHSDNVGDL